MNQKGNSVLYLIIGVLVLVIVGGGVYYFRQNHTEQQTFTWSEPNSLIYSPPTPTVALDQTTNWQIYSFSKTISLKLPSNLNIPKYVNSGHYAVATILPSNTTLQIWGADGASPSENKDNFDSLRGEIIGNSNFQITPFNLANKQAIEFTNNKATSDEIEGGDLASKMRGILVKMDDGRGLIIIHYQGQTLQMKGDFQKDDAIFDQILSTFTFNDQNQTLDTSNWKIYTNSHYNFTLTYPATGIVIDSNAQPQGMGACGNSIKESNDESGHDILVDNFFRIIIMPWTQTFGDYTKQQDPNNFYLTTPINGSGADDALTINDMKPGISSNAGGTYDIAHNIQETGFGMTSNIYKKGSNLFIISRLQNSGNVGGCIWDDNIKKTWDVSRSVHFN